MTANFIPLATWVLGFDANVLFGIPTAQDKLLVCAYHLSNWLILLAYGNLMDGCLGILLGHYLGRYQLSCEQQRRNDQDSPRKPNKMFRLFLQVRRQVFLFFGDVNELNHIRTEPVRLSGQILNGCRRIFGNKNKQITNVPQELNLPRTSLRPIYRGSCLHLFQKCMDFRIHKNRAVPSKCNETPGAAVPSIRKG